MDRISNNKVYTHFCYRSCNVWLLWSWSICIGWCLNFNQHKYKWTKWCKTAVAYGKQQRLENRLLKGYCFIGFKGWWWINSIECKGLIFTFSWVWSYHEWQYSSLYSSLLLCRDINDIDELKFPKALHLRTGK